MSTSTLECARSINWLVTQTKVVKTVLAKNFTQPYVENGKREGGLALVGIRSAKKFTPQFPKTSPWSTMRGPKKLILLPPVTGLLLHHGHTNMHGKKEGNPSLLICHKIRLILRKGFKTCKEP